MFTEIFKAGNQNDGYGKSYSTGSAVMKLQSFYNIIISIIWALPMQMKV
jgi:hypothetical protein